MKPHTSLSLPAFSFSGIPSPSVSNPVSQSPSISLSPSLFLCFLPRLSRPSFSLCLSQPLCQLILIIAFISVSCCISLFCSSMLISVSFHICLNLCRFPRLGVSLSLFVLISLLLVVPLSCFTPDQLKATSMPSPVCLSLCLCRLYLRSCYRTAKRMHCTIFIAESAKSHWKREAPMWTREREQPRHKQTQENNYRNKGFITHKQNSPVVYGDTVCPFL